MAASRIVRLRAYAVPAAVAAPRGQGPGLELLRLTLADGSEGFAGVSGDGTAVLPSAEAMAHCLLGADAGRRAHLGNVLSAAEASMVVASLCDIALWDAWGRHLDVPLWQLLGGFRERLPACAVLAESASVEAALDDVRRVAAMGYRGVKLSLGRDAAFDLELVGVVAAAFADSELRFMADLGQRYRLDDAVRLGRRLADLGFDRMEAPFPDQDVESYAALRQAVAIDLLPSGGRCAGPRAWCDALRGGAWSRLRVDACTGGGIGGILRAVALADALGVPVDLRSLGHPPSQAANLHLMLGLPGCTWFEHGDPLRPLDYGVRMPLAIDAEGRMAAPDGPGLGLLMDWPRIEADAAATFDSGT
jgi:L-alanine-DL-glutamate epimerase-like enolase superfamily enzyme